MQAFVDNEASLLTVLAALVWLAVVTAILVSQRRELSRAWCEPVLRWPVLILESDDWGAGPMSQAAALSDIAQVLKRHRDTAGRHPVMSLALVLAVPDGPAIRARGGYRRIELDAQVLAPVLAMLKAGSGCQVFSLQLHGHEHFWPAALLTSDDANARAWLREPPLAATEKLPSHLQSRWVDASHLPSRPLASDAIRAAVEEEIRAYARILGEPAAVVVPPTFVWTREVERAWAAAGIQFVVTPGWRSTQRNAQGEPDGDEGPISNGEGRDGLTYLVRTDYFEPARGRDAAHAIRALARAVAKGQPCVLENHRDNFIFDAEASRRSLAELDALFSGALRQYPCLRFLSTVELGRIVRDRDPRWLVTSWRQRLPFVWQRLRHSSRPWKLMQWTGLAALGSALVRLLGQQPSRTVTAPAS